MSSSFGGLNTLVRGLTANQVALNTVGHNISNANTAGYSRQAVNLSSSLPEAIYGSSGRMQLGTGVDIQSITRARDTFMDQQMWKENSTLGYGETQKNLLSQVEGVFHEPTDTGLKTVLDKFWSSWQSLATNASDDSTRSLVIQRGAELVDSVQQANTQLRDIVSGINSDLSLKVSTVNQISADILMLNKQISTSEIGNNNSGSANDLRDRRDLLVDQLSQLVNVRVTEDNDGNYTVQSGSLTLVNANRSTTLETYASKDPDYNYEVLNLQVNGVSVTLGGGELQGLIDMRDDTTTGVKGYLNQVSTVSEFLLRDFNAIHRAGYGEDEVNGRNFFGESSTPYDDASYLDPADSNFKTKGDWISELSVNAEFYDQKTNPTGLQKIAAKALATEGDASGTNALKLGQALRINVQDTTLLGAGYNATLGSSASLSSFYTSMIGALGVQGESATRLTENQQILVDQIESWRQSVSGVNLDEEMSNMIRFQKGYNASARVLTTMDEMLDKLINSTGTVGR